MNEDGSTKVATGAIDAFGSADWSRFRGLLAADVRYEETGTGRSTVGADAYLELCQGWKRAFPDAHGIIHRSISSGDTVVQEILWTGTHEGPLKTPAGEVPDSGARMEMPATWWVTLDGEQIKTIRHHLDVFSMLRQIGAIK